MSEVVVPPDSAEEPWLLSLDAAGTALWRKLIREVPVDSQDGSVHGEMIALIGELGYHGQGNADRALAVMEEWSAMILDPPAEERRDRVCRQMLKDSGLVVAASLEVCTPADVRKALDDAICSIQLGGDAISVDRRERWATQMLDAFEGAWSRDTPRGHEHDEEADTPADGHGPPVDQAGTGQGRPR